MPPKNIVQIVFFVLTGVNGLLYLSTVIALLQQHVGEFGYVLWIPVAPFLSPAIFVLPWFHAWVNNEGLNNGIFVLWTLWIAAFSALALYESAVAGMDRFRKPKNRA